MQLRAKNASGAKLTQSSQEEESELDVSISNSPVKNALGAKLTQSSQEEDSELDVSISHSPVKSRGRYGQYAFRSAPGDDEELQENLNVILMIY